MYRPALVIFGKRTEYMAILEKEPREEFFDMAGVLNMKLPPRREMPRDAWDKLRAVAARYVRHVPEDRL